MDVAAQGATPLDIRWRRTCMHIGRLWKVVGDGRRWWVMVGHGGSCLVVFDWYWGVIDRNLLNI